MWESGNRKNNRPFLPIHPDYLPFEDRVIPSVLVGTVILDIMMHDRRVGERAGRRAGMRRQYKGIVLAVRPRLGGTGCWGRGRGDHDALKEVQHVRIEIGIVVKRVCTVGVRSLHGQRWNIGGRDARMANRFQEGVDFFNESWEDVYGNCC